MPPFVRNSIICAVLAGCAPVDDATSDSAYASAHEMCGGRCVERSEPPMFDYGELTQLSALPGGRGALRYLLEGGDDALEDKLNRLLDEPTISNEAFYRGARPHRPTDPELGPTIRAAVWNIERGQELALIREAFLAAADPSARERFIAERVRPDVQSDPAIQTQLDALAKLDIIVLNETDIGMKRSGYAHVAEELATALDMNFAFAVEFVEIDPIALGLEKFAAPDFLPADGETGATIDDGSVPLAERDKLAAEANELSSVDAERARNLHGNAILSRYPIVSTKVLPLKTRCWDWNADERKPRDLAGRGMAYLSEKVFLEKSMREMRHGGRTMLMVDLYVPGENAVGTTMEYVPGVRSDVVTVVNAHLEAKSTPSCRKEQMKEILAQVAQIKNPVILAGDLNTLGTDGRPMTVERLLFSRFYDPEWIARQMIGRLSPYAGWVFTMRDVLNWIRLKDDPTGIDIPFLLPNDERGLFDAIEGHRFADGGVFDFRGDEVRTVNETAKTLANSNQRDDKGFKTTFAFQRTLGIGDFTFFGKFKLDWMFVRGWARSPRDGRASYRMAPHFPRTLEELRDATSPRLSDHAPLTVLLPIQDPCKEGTCPNDPVSDLEYGTDDWTDTYGE